MQTAPGRSAGPSPRYWQMAPMSGGSVDDAWSSGRLSVNPVMNGSGSCELNEWLNERIKVARCIHRASRGRCSQI